MTENEPESNVNFFDQKTIRCQELKTKALDFAVRGDRGVVYSSGNGLKLPDQYDVLKKAKEIYNWLIEEE